MVDKTPPPVHSSDWGAALRAARYLGAGHAEEEGGGVDGEELWSAARGVAAVCGRVGVATPVLCVLTHRTPPTRRRGQGAGEIDVRTLTGHRVRLRRPSANGHSGHSGFREKGLTTGYEKLPSKEESQRYTATVVEPAGRGRSRVGV